MSNEQKNIQLTVRRDHAEDYILTSLVAFGVTVIFTRLFLQLTGFPQLGDSVLHIAHVIWGGLLLFIAALLPLIFANRWAIKASALLSGIGIGLFIDEVGKFITQTNDYFFPPALSLIYGFFLLNVFVYLYFRRPYKKDPRIAMYHAFEGLQSALDGNLNTEEAVRIESQLAIAKKSDRDDIVSLANIFSNYLKKQKRHLLAAKPDYWERTIMWVDTFGRRLGRHIHRNIISMLIIFWVIVVIGYIFVILFGDSITLFFVGKTILDPQVVQWRAPLTIIQIITGSLMIISLLAWLTKNEERGLKFAVSGFLLSLVALQLIYFYLSQFAAITVTLLQFIFLQILLAYRRWYLNEPLKRIT